MTHRAISWRQRKLKNQYFYIITLRPLTTTPRGQPRSRLMTPVPSSSILYLSNSLVSTPSFRRFIPPPRPHEETRRLLQVHPRKVCPTAPFKRGLSPAEGKSANQSHPQASLSAPVPAARMDFSNPGHAFVVCNQGIISALLAKVQ